MLKINFVLNFSSIRCFVVQFSVAQCNVILSIARLVSSSIQGRPGVTLSCAKSLNTQYCTAQSSEGNY